MKAVLLLSGAFICVVIAAGVMTFRTASKAKIGGPLYRRIIPGNAGNIEKAAQLDRQSGQLQSLIGQLASILGRTSSTSGVPSTPSDAAAIRLDVENTMAAHA